MSTYLTDLPRGGGEAVPDLCRRLGLFSFQEEASAAGLAVQGGLSSDLGLRPGGIVEWLAAAPGAGAVTSAVLMASRLSPARGALAIVDAARECHAPALSGWGISPGRTLLVIPADSRRKRAGRSSSACDVRASRPRGPASSSGFRRPCSAAGNWPRKSAAAWACCSLRMRRDGNPRGPTCVCASRPYREAGVTPDGSESMCCIAGAASEAAPRYGRSTMPRVMCVWFPNWPIQRLRTERRELRRSELVLFARQGPSDRSSRSVLPRPIATASGSASRWPKPGRSCPGPSTFPPMTSPTPAPFASGRSSVSASLPWSAWRTALIPPRCSPASTVARTSGTARNDSSGRSETTGRGETISSGSPWPAPRGRRGPSRAPRRPRVVLRCTGWRRSGGFVGPAGGGLAIAAKPASALGGAGCPGAGHDR